METKDFEMRSIYFTEKEVNDMKKILENKKLMAGCIAGIVAIAVLVLVIVLAAGGNSGNGGSTGTNSSVPGVTDGTQKPSIDPTDTLPDESTGATDPTESTGGADETDPTETVEPADPTETTPPETEPVTEPSTEPEETWIPTEDPNAKPTEGETFDFGNVTPSTLTYEEWSSWSREKQDTFIGTNGYKGGMINWTAEEKHKFYCAENNNYDCGYEGHWCTNSLDHAYAMAQINKGCEHCGKHDCPSLFSHDKDGSWKYDHTLCPEYDVKKDEDMYCQHCGLPKRINAQIGEEMCQRAIQSDYECSHCGKTVYINTCHHCKKAH